MNYLIGDAQFMASQLLHGYQSLYAMKLPVYNDHTFKLTHFWQTFVENSTSATMKELAKNYSNDRALTTAAIVMELVKPSMQIINMQELAFAAFEQLSDAIVKLTEDLEAYKMSNEADQQFFM